MLNFEETLNESEEMAGPLGAVAFITLKAVETAGAPPDEIAKLRDLLFKHFGKLTDADCEVLADVAHARLKDRPESGKWY